MKKLLHRIIAKFMIKWLSNARHESTLKVLNHAILKEMVRLKSEELEITYTGEWQGKTYTVVTTSVFKDNEI